MLNTKANLSPWTMMNSRFGQVFLRQLINPNVRCGKDYQVFASGSTWSCNRFPFGLNGGRHVQLLGHTLIPKVLQGALDHAEFFWENFLYKQRDLGKAHSSLRKKKLRKKVAILKMLRSARALLAAKRDHLPQRARIPCSTSDTRDWSILELKLSLQRKWKELCTCTYGDP